MTTAFLITAATGTAEHVRRKLWIPDQSALDTQLILESDLEVMANAEKLAVCPAGSVADPFRGG